MGTLGAPHGPASPLGRRKMSLYDAFRDVFSVAAKLVAEEFTDYLRA
jgi:hypothetical protein